jgi:FdrA protein
MIAETDARRRGNALPAATRELARKAAMASAIKVIRNLYRDSVAMMQLSQSLRKLPGVTEASAVVASPANLALLREAGLVKGAVDAGPNDLLIALGGADPDLLAAALTEAEAALAGRPETKDTGSGPTAPRSIAMALAATPGANLALISTPGEYAAAEAEKALRLGLNVMLFSDNVAIEDEIRLKRLAAERDLLVMGPDCGTAIIDGVPLAFANVVRRGSIGCVAASGTGLQQVTCLVDRLGAGISQAIGTGGHDLSRAVGGISMLQGLKKLAADPETAVIVLISKPPAPEIAERVLDVARRSAKPVVVSFVGADPMSINGGNLHAAATLEDAALIAVSLAEGRQATLSANGAFGQPTFARGQRYLRGLYSGGTFCYEASLLLGRALGRVWSNAPVDAKDRLEDVWTLREHTVIDLGDDVFTRGRPHPMIDHRLRNERLLEEAADPSVAVILLDVVLGYGSHPDPAGEMAPVILEARRVAQSAGRTIAVVGFVCGTAGDPQDLVRQEARLREAGMTLTQSNAAAVRLAGRLVTASVA